MSAESSTARIFLSMLRDLWSKAGRRFLPRNPPPFNRFKRRPPARRVP
jgi:hypothetical protein